MFVKVVASLLAVFLAMASAGLVGAAVNADLNSPEVHDALRFAVAQYNAESDSEYISQVVKVIQAQVVSGYKYIFTVELAKTSCKKGATENTVSTIDSVPVTAQPHECIFAVWSQPWLNSMILTENTC